MKESDIIALASGGVGAILGIAVWLNSRKGNYLIVESNSIANDAKSEAAEANGEAKKEAIRARKREAVTKDEPLRIDAESMLYDISVFIQQCWEDPESGEITNTALPSSRARLAAHKLRLLADQLESNVERDALKTVVSYTERAAGAFAAWLHSMAVADSRPENEDSRPWEISQVKRDEAEEAEMSLLNAIATAREVLSTVRGQYLL